MGQCYGITVELSPIFGLIFFLKVADLQNAHAVYYLEFALSEACYFLDIRWLYHGAGFFSFYFQVDTAWTNVGCGSICYLIYRAVTPTVGCLEHINPTPKFFGRGV